MKRIRIHLAILLMATLPALAAENFTCPMHPHYIASEAGNCPICGMTLVPVENEPDTRSHSATQADNPESRLPITIAPETIQNIGVRTEPATIARFGTEVRSYGLVTENMRQSHSLSGRVAGWIEELQITAVGDEVKKGDLLFTLYSPDLISAQRDYLAALKTGLKGRISSSAKRLRSLGAGEKALSQLRKKRQKLEQFPVYAKTNGIVSKLMINQGSYIKPGLLIATIQSYESIWLEVSVAEKDLPFLNERDHASVNFPSLGNTTRLAQIDYIYPTIDQASRTGKVRLVLENTDGSIRPGSYADVIFETEIEKRLSIPSEAILKSSNGDFVVLALGQGRFRSQNVATGIQNKGYTEIKQGVKDGEKVVVSSQFLIDSESSLRESFRKLQRVQTPLALLEISQDQMAMIDHMVDAALYLHEVQTTDLEFDPKMLMPALKLGDHLLLKFRGTKLQFVLEDSEKALNQAKEAITDAELKQAMAQLVKALRPWITEGNPKHYKDKGVSLYLDHGTGNHWIQLTDEMKHPYGQGHAVKLELPNSVEAEAPEINLPAGGAHANH